jgi:hypothetical protein
MLDRESWLPLAQRLGLKDGEHRRVNHNCGQGRTLSLSRDGPRYSARCWRCNDGDSYKEVESPAATLQRLRQQRDADLARQVAADPPVGVGYASWPAPARLWFARAGLSAHDAGRLGATYDTESRRVILPCGGSFWQGRGVHAGQQPKYIAPDQTKVYPRHGTANAVTLVEDILSAYKVGRYGEGWCMLGTALPPALFAEIIKRGCPVNVWLDNDLPPTHTVNRGQIAARKIIKQLRAAGVEVRNIVTDVDPKLLHYSQIKGLL